MNKSHKKELTTMHNIRNVVLLPVIILILFCLNVDISAGIHSYKSSSVLSEGRFVKVRIKESGVYKLTFDDLNTMGVNPANVRIFGYGGAILNQSFLTSKIDDLPEVAIHMEKGSDGVFNTGDYVLFYAQGVNSWVYNTSLGMFTHTINHYSTYGYYFVTSDAGEGRKIKAVDIETPATYTDVTEFTDYSVHEKELQSLANSGKEFYGETFSDVLSYSLNYTFPNLVKSANTVKVRLDVAASSTVASNFLLDLGSAQSKTLSVAARTPNDIYERARLANGIYTFTPSADLLNFNLSYVKANSTSKGYLNYLEMNVRRSMIMTGVAMRFQNVDYLGTDSYSRFQLSNAGPNTKIWDITNQSDITSINDTLNDGVLSFFSSNKTLKIYMAIDPTAGGSFPKPEIVGVVANQNLHGLPQVDMIIISHPAFLSQAQRLAQAHNNMGEISVEAVTTEQVYNEFSSGTPDATAYRWMMKMLYDRAVNMNDLSKRPKYLLLFGRGSFDNRKVIPSSVEGYVLTYQAENSHVETMSYVTDDYFAFLEDSEGNQVPAHTMDIGIGRFPVTSLQTATDVVTKTINYMQNTNRGIWKNQLCYLADDGDGSLHMKQSDSVASYISRTYPSFQVNKIFLDAYQQEVNASGETYPVARTQFHNLLRNGLFLLDYVGHAGPTGWTNEQILSTADVKGLSNKNLPLWVAATCDFLQFDIATVSAGEHVLLNPVGGGIGIISAARPVYASQNERINKLINQYLFQKENGKYPRVGDVIAKAKNNLGSEINKLSYVYMGDPALRLNYPGQYQIITEKINGTLAAGKDTLRALSVTTINGYIADLNGNPVPAFNGSLSASIFDKAVTITTLNNDKTGTFTYNDRPNVLFSGSTEVVNGKFEITFMLPKDIKYNYGTGRINFYANDDALGEAQGSFENFLIGGSISGFEYETDGPQIEMYLNGIEFVSGEKVNETPLLIAKVSDVNGINQVGSGIGHDIMLIVDDDPGQAYILNDFYKSDINDFTKGTIRFKLPVMKSGKHTVSLRAWDLLNNSSIHTIDFEVVKGLEPQIFSIYNYPNPVKSYTKFVVEHDRPETVLNATVDVFDVSGRRVWSFTQSTLDEITWDMNDLYGQRLKTGVYLYRVSILSNSNQVFSKINKLMIVE
ncbi:MAG: type IX secretion system sortase PorU [Paludibacter sp.]|nr:type IX secretion system sortase PorU [Paludibacter sp.]